jgi:hypothetical protein
MAIECKMAILAAMVWRETGVLEVLVFKAKTADGSGCGKRASDERKARKTSLRG